MSIKITSLAGAWQIGLDLGLDDTMHTRNAFQLGARAVLSLLTDEHGNPNNLSHLDLLLKINEAMTKLNAAVNNVAKSEGQC